MDRFSRFLDWLMIVTAPLVLWGIWFTDEVWLLRLAAMVFFVEGAVVSLRDIVLRKYGRAC